jgi:hypothetical protein
VPSGSRRSSTASRASSASQRSVRTARTLMLGTPRNPSPGQVDQHCARWPPHQRCDDSARAMFGRSRCKGNRCAPAPRSGRASRTDSSPPPGTLKRTASRHDMRTTFLADGTPVPVFEPGDLVRLAGAVRSCPRSRSAGTCRTRRWW